MGRPPAGGDWICPRKWGGAVDDSKLHALVQRVGAKAEEQTRERITTPAQEREPQRKASELGVLLVDGWLVRHRGPGWGAKKTKASRVARHVLQRAAHDQVE